MTPQNDAYPSISFPTGPVSFDFDFRRWGLSFPATHLRARHTICSQLCLTPTGAGKEGTVTGQWDFWNQMQSVQTLLDGFPICGERKPSTVLPPGENDHTCWERLAVPPWMCRHGSFWKPRGGVRWKLFSDVRALGGQLKGMTKEGRAEFKAQGRSLQA